jgi:hypothetical protein
MKALVVASMFAFTVHVPLVHANTNDEIPAVYLQDASGNVSGDNTGDNSGSWDQGGDQQTDGQAQCTCGTGDNGGGNGGDNGDVSGNDGGDDGIDFGLRFGGHGSHNNGLMALMEMFMGLISGGNGNGGGHGHGHGHGHGDPIVLPMLGQNQFGGGQNGSAHNIFGLGGNFQLTPVGTTIYNAGGNGLPIVAGPAGSGGPGGFSGTGWGSLGGNNPAVIQLANQSGMNYQFGQQYNWGGVYHSQGGSGQSPPHVLQMPNQASNGKPAIIYL